MRSRLWYKRVMTEPSTITTEVRGHVFLIGLDRPHKLNAFNLAMLRELSLAFSRYEREPDLWCAVLFAHGDNFTAGLDLAEVGPAVASGQPLFPENGVDPLDLFTPPGGARRTKPVVCTVQGWCLTIGMELLMAADIRVAAKGTRFSQLEVKRGIMPFGGATLRFPQFAGWGNAMRYLLTGDEFGAAEALRMGLVQEVVEDGEQVARAIELAQRVARQAPLAVQATLASARTAVEQDAPAALEALMDQARGLMGSEDAREGVRSFIERREAVFKGK
jgi:enoyl-CoA hydratase/carnithine racemase